MTQLGALDAKQQKVDIRKFWKMEGIFERDDTGYSAEDFLNLILNSLMQELQFDANQIEKPNFFKSQFIF